MKKLLLLLISLTLVLSATFTAFAAGNEDFSDKVKEKEYKVQQVKQEKMNPKKAFKQELNAQKREIAKAKGVLGEQKQELEAQYQELLTAGDTAGAEALFVKISDLDTQIAEKKMQMKKIINERYMVIKSEYSDAELAQFENAAALIEKMYEDAAILGLGAIIVKDNIIKFDAPAYIKGGRTIIPVRAITEELGATVNWDQDTQSVSITKENIEIVFTINSKKVFVDGVEQELDVSTEITNGRTYVPLRFIAETFGLTVSWDDENGTIDIEDEQEIEDEPVMDE